MREERWRFAGPLVAGLAASVVAASVVAGTALAGDTARPDKPDKPAKAEPIPGSDLKRVILTAKAAERLALRTALVEEAPVRRWLVVGGTVGVVLEEPTLAHGR